MVVYLSMPGFHDDPVAIELLFGLQVVPAISPQGGESVRHRCSASTAGETGEEL